MDLWMAGKLFSQLVPDGRQEHRSSSIPLSLVITEQLQNILNNFNTFRLSSRTGRHVLRPIRLSLFLALGTHLPISSRFDDMDLPSERPFVTLLAQKVNGRSPPNVAAVGMRNPIKDEKRILP